MFARSVYQRIHLLALAARISLRKQPLGIGLHHQCWGGVAAEVARTKGSPTTAYYGLSFREFKDAIKSNNLCPPLKRNRHMFLRSLRLALLPAARY